MNPISPALLAVFGAGALEGVSPKSKSSPAARRATEDLAVETDRKPVAMGVTNGSPGIPSAVAIPWLRQGGHDSDRCSMTKMYLAILGSKIPSETYVGSVRK